MFAEASSLLENLPNGGAVVAIIAVVVLFLKKQERSEDAIKAALLEYREHVDSIMRLGLDAHHETRDAIRRLDATLRRTDGSEAEGVPRRPDEAK